MSVRATSHLTEVIQRIISVFPRSRAARVLASGAVLLLLYKLFHGPRKPKRKYVNLTAAKETGDAKGLASEYDIIIVGGGMLSFFLNVGNSYNDFWG